MADPNSDGGHVPRKRRWSFGLRSLLLLVLLMATYSAGWVSHRTYHNRHLRQRIEAAIEQIQANNVEVEAVDELGITVLKGKKADVQSVQSAIKEIEVAAGL